MIICGDGVWPGRLSDCCAAVVRVRQARNREEMNVLMVCPTGFFGLGCVGSDMQQRTKGAILH